MHRDAYPEPVTITFQKFEWLREQLKKEGFNLDCRGSRYLAGGYRAFSGTGRRRHGCKREVRTWARQNRSSVIPFITLLAVVATECNKN